MQIYIHIPFCEKKCNYCDFLSGPADASVREMYVNALIKEIRGRAANVGRHDRVSTIYFGGGTPSVLSAKQLGDLIFTIGQEYSVESDAEITIEVNPKSADRDKLYFLRANGFNRLSIGMQSSHRGELELLGRIHTYEDFLTCYGNARDTGFSNISVDIMTAVPGQTEQMLASTVDKVIALDPEHISTYSLTIERGTPFYERFGDIEGPVIGEEAERRLYWMTVDKLKDRGYRHYEISNFAKPGYESRHNSGYWKRKDYLGMGLGASSCTVTPGGDERSRNVTDLKTYLENPLAREESNVLSRNDMIEETMYLGLRMMEGVDTDDFEKKFGVTVRSLYGDVIDDLVAQGLIYEGSSSLSLTDLGIDYGNHVFAKFLW
ncbi:MAG: radical SAM family heme chaperone HemW [Lachnospiraceae bacterium]|nr:radical SAM family heme chaperone HemW [Lachnospiraceae bacterium]